MASAESTTGKEMLILLDLPIPASFRPLFLEWTTGHANFIEWLPG